MKKVLTIFLFISAMSASSIFAQKVYTPKKDSAERKEILNTLRVPIEKELKQKIQFSVNQFNISGNWVFISGEPQNTKGEKPDYTGTKYEEEVNEGMFDHNFFALLKKSGKKWKVVTYALGCTDVCYLDWDSQFKAPKAIFEIPD